MNAGFLDLSAGSQVLGLGQAPDENDAEIAVPRHTPLALAGSASERPHPSAQASLFEELDGWRYLLFATNTPVTTRSRLGQIAFLEARHRAQVRVESCIRNGKSAGLNHLPSKHAGINQAWLTAVAIACDLLTRLRLL